MGRIQSGTGLVSGIPIVDTVNQLMAISARPRDRIISQNNLLQQQQVAITELTALVTGLQFALDRLKVEDVFNQKTVTSQNPELLTATATGDPPEGIFQFTPIRRAQSHHVVSSGLTDLDDPVGEGSLKIRFGGLVDEGNRLEELNAGAGAERGKIRITDRSGASAVIDLRFALTVDEVLQAINSNDQINVTAVTEGDTFRLIDNTGQSVTNLSVQEFGLGKTAADLGLAGIDVSADEATGTDVFHLYDNLRLDRLNEGRGVGINAALPDLKVTFRDGSSPLQIDFHSANTEATLGELLQTINDADPSRLRAEISADGDRLELTDLTTGAGTFSVVSEFDGTVAEDLGLTGTASGGVITGGRLQAGLKTTLIGSLAGGSGLELGLLYLQDRAASGPATIDLTSAETLDDVIREINYAGVGITARINDARNGILINDTTSGSGNLVVANLGGTKTADQLGITIDAATSTVDGGSLDRQIVYRNTSLDSLSGGRGVTLGSFLITDSAGATSGLNLLLLETETVGEVIDAVNGLGIGVTARINDSGDGILLVDTAGGAGTLQVDDVGTSVAAANLKIAGAAVEVDIDGIPTQVIDGSTALTVEISADETLEDIVEKINAFDSGVTASAINLGAGSAPYRLSLVANVSGRAGQLVVDSSNATFAFQEIAAAQDALLLFGSADGQGAGLLASSSTDTFDQIIDGVQLTVNGSSTEAVGVEINTTDENLVNRIEGFVDEFNRLHDKLNTLTLFNEQDNTTGILFGTIEALRVETGFANLLTSRFIGAGSIGSLGELGLSLNENGKLTFDRGRFSEKFTDDPNAVEEFFTHEELGLNAKLTVLVDQLAGDQNSLLANRADSLQRTIRQNNDHVQNLNERLNRERELLLSQFYLMEAAIARMQLDLNAITSLSALPPLSITLGQ